MNEARVAIDELLKELEEDEHVVFGENGTKTVCLREPIEVKRGKDKEEIDEVVFPRKPKGKDWLRVDEEQGDLAKSFRLASLLTGLPFKAFHDMDGEDALLCGKVAMTMGKDSRDGGTS